MKRIYGCAVLIAGLVVAPASNVLAQNLQQIGTLVIEGVTKQPVPIFSAGVQYAASSGSSFTSGRGGAGKVEFSFFTLTKRVDATSPKLLVSISGSEHFKKVTLDLFDPTQTTELTRYELENVVAIGAIVKSLEDGETYSLVEDISLDYAKIKQTVFTSSGQVQGCWDRMMNKNC